jgi:uncharacterized membrane protein (UPF0127 family)
VVWQQDGGDRVCLRANVVGDSQEATVELGEALRRWAEWQEDASVEVIGEQVALTACIVRANAWSAQRYADDVEIDCPGTPLRGFGEAQVSITGADGDALRRCLLLADTPQRVARGLMEVTDPALGGYDGMLFVYPYDTEGAYWMRNTPMPLSIAFLDGDGRVVSTADMAPCGDSLDCPRYRPDGPYRFAVEVPQGRLDRFGLVGTITLRIDAVSGAG